MGKVLPLQCKKPCGLVCTHSKKNKLLVDLNLMRYTMFMVLISCTYTVHTMKLSLLKLNCICCRGSKDDSDEVQFKGLSVDLSPPKFRGLEVNFQRSLSTPVAIDRPIIMDSNVAELYDTSPPTIPNTSPPLSTQKINPINPILWYQTDTDLFKQLMMTHDSLTMCFWQ